MPTPETYYTEVRIVRSDGMYGRFRIKVYAGSLSAAASLLDIWKLGLETTSNAKAIFETIHVGITSKGDSKYYDYADKQLSNDIRTFIQASKPKES